MSAASGVSGGGFVVKNNDLWFAGRTDFDLPANGLYRVDFDCDPDIDPDCVTFHKPPYPVLPYGINIDKAQNIWIAGQFDQVIRYEPAADAWTEFRPQIDPVLAGNNIMRGMVVDDDGIAWVAVGNLQVNQGQNPRIVRLDPTADPPTVQAYGPETIKELANPSA